MPAKKTSPPNSVRPETATVMNAFRALVRELRSLDRDVFRKYGLGSAQIFVLHCLAKHEPLSVNDLAEKALSDQSTISLIVSKLVARELVDSRRSESDARRAELRLTKRGRAVVAKLPLIFQENFIGSLERMPPARLKMLASTLSELLELMNVDASHPPLLLVDEAPRRKSAARKEASPSKKPVAKKRSSIG